MPQPTMPYQPIAITGIHGRFPAAQDTWQFWQNLTSAKDTIQQVPAERWLWQEYDETTAQGENLTYSHCAGFMPMPEKFDAKFFGILPREAEAMDPMQRLMLQTSWNALEDAGYNPRELKGQKVGVFVGVGHADYPVLMRENAVPIDTYRGTGMALTAIANKVSFYFDFHGPSESIDTACSSSLVALHRAASALREGECEIAIVGGVNLLLGPELFIAFGKAGMLSHKGCCQTFDNNADGYVRGEGVAAIVLTPLKQAEQNKDYVYAVLRGSAENHGGRAHSFTAPNVNAQADVISQAWSRAGLTPADADVIESHGTGTPLGDPIEINAIKKAVSQTKNPIAIGALKSHIGHLEAAAGIASVIKSILSMQHQLIPRNLHFNQLNQHIDLEDSALFFPTENQPWPSNGEQPMRAGISSFGFGGVNAHIVLESSPIIDEEIELPEAEAEQKAYLIPISAQDKDSLFARIQQLTAYLEEDELAAQENFCALVLSALQQQLKVQSKDDPTLHQLNLSPAALQKVLSQVTTAFDIQATLADVRGCQKISELAQRLTEIKWGDNRQVESQSDHLLCATNIPRKLICKSSLQQLSYTLINGRSTLAQRVAFVCQSKTELLHLLRSYLLQHSNTQTFLTDTNDWFCGRPKNSNSEKPVSTTQSAETSITALESWAHYWIENRKAELIWQEIYPTAPVPSKLPLPAYPFKLQHVWFKTEETATSARMNISTESTLALSCWKKACEDKMLFPSSQASLAHLLSQQTSTQHNRFTNIVFGPPNQLEVTDTLEIIKHPRSNLSQCLNRKTQQVLVQAQSDQTTITTDDEKLVLPQNTQELSKEKIYQIFSQLDVVFPEAAQNIVTAQSATTHLQLHFSNKIENRSEPVFWSLLLSHLFAASKYLNDDKASLPYQIAEIVYFPAQRGNQISLTIYKAINATTLGAQIYSGENLVAQLTGIELRTVPVTETELVMEPQA